MTYERFAHIILRLKQQDEVINDLYKNKVDLIDFVDPYHVVITELIKEIYGDIGYDIFSWFCYENDYGHKDWSNTPTYTKDENGKLKLVDIDKDSNLLKYGMTDENNNPICYSIESTWKYLEDIKNKK